jgi:outer membrane immunogenic protein
MKRLLLSGAALFALTSASYAADPAVYEPVDIWSGYFVGVQLGGMSGEAGLTFYDDTGTGTEDDAEDVFDHGFVGGLYYGRNWQSGNWIFGLDSSFSYLGWDEELDVLVDGRPNGDIEAVDVDADLLGLSRLKVGYAMGNVNVFVAGGLASTIFEAEMTDGGVTDDDDDWAFGWTVGAGIEGMISENWSARIEAIYADIESDDLDGPGGTAIEADLEVTIVRAGVAYHF